ATFFNTDASQIVTPTVYNDNNWHFAVFTYANETETLYVDGQSVGYQTQAEQFGYSSSYAYFVGTGYTAQTTAGNWDWLYFNGQLDEFSVSNTARSSDWIKTEYNNQSSPSTFYEFYSPGSVQVVPSAVSLYAGQSQQFATTGSFNTALNWLISSGTQGTITTNGLFIAPSSISTKQTVTVSAINPANNTTIGSAVVTLLPQAPPITLSASTQPPYTTGNAQEFVATLRDQDGTPENGVVVTFTINGANNSIASSTTDSNGVASYTYIGVNKGNDTIQATANFNGQLFTSNSVVASWGNPLPPNPEGSVTLLAPAALGQIGLCGAFTDNNGAVIQPIAIGASSRTFVVPAGATQLQLGVANNWYGIDQGSGFVVEVNGNPVSVPPTAMPWKWIAGQLNVNYEFGLNDGTSPVPAATGLTQGELITIAYQSGTASSGVLSHPMVNADGDQAWIPGIQLWQGTYFPTLYITPSSYPIGQPITFNAHVTNGAGAALSNVPVTLNITGANAQQLQTTTDSTGTAAFLYSGLNAGTDSLQAQALLSGQPDLASNQTSVTWVNYATPPQAGSLTLNNIAIIGSTQGVYAMVTDASGHPVYNADVGFYVTGAETFSKDNTTDTTGRADFGFNHTNSGTINIVAVDSINRNIVLSNIISGPWPVTPPTAGGPSGPITIDISANNSVNLPDSLQLTGTVTDTNLSAPNTPQLVWSEISGPGTITFSNPQQTVSGNVTTESITASFSSIGNYVLQLNASDLENSVPLQFPVTANPPLQDPQGWISSPTYGSTVTGFVPITLADGIVLQPGGSLVYYPANNPSNVTPLQISGNGSGTIATLDTTTMLNGTYWIQLQATDSSNKEQYSLILVTVAGNYKPGRLTTTVTDLVVPASGIPINIQRVYDSLEAGTSSDFGFGWSLGVNTNLTVDPKNNVTFTLGGQRRTFYFTPTEDSWVLPIIWASYTPEPGFRGTMTDSASGCIDGLDILAADGYCIDGGQFNP
ncbi:MAG: Ig-like domain-containing protein, partial [Terracidiphilus sp.]